LLVAQAIEPAQPLSDFWLQLQSDEDVARRRRDVSQLTELLAEMIARAHQAGFEHLDMHAANILVQPLGPRRYRTVFVDLQVARRGVPLSDWAVVRNLAQLNQWFYKHSSASDRLRFLRAYLRWRNEFETAFEPARPLGLDFAQLVAALKVAAERHARRLGAQRDRRITRNGRYFTRIRLPGGWRGMAVLSCKHPTDESRASRLTFDPQWWCRRLRRPLAWFADAQICKESHSAQVRRALLEHRTGNLAVIIKRPQARNWKRRLAQSWPPSRSLRGWRMGHALLHRDVPTARPLAVLERRLGPIVLDSLLVTEAIPGGLDLESFLRREQAARSPTGWLCLRRELCQRLAAHLRRLHQRGFEHRDCKASNILVIEHPQLKLLWIDLDGLRHAREWGPRSQPLSHRLESRCPQRELRPLVRLHVSLRDLPGLSRTDRLRFLKAYFARYGVLRDAWRPAWRAMEEAVEKKTRARQVRRAWKLRHYGRE
jgi:tRNA A-37 threonylcarbamoyl transferase component Bud32